MILKSRTFRKDYFVNGKPVALIATAKIEHIQGNRQPHFSITADLYESYQQRGEPTVKSESGKTLWLSSCGQLTDEVNAHIPELSSYLQYHLSDNDGTPMYYLENGLYWFKEGNFDYFKSTVRWGDAPENLKELSAEDVKAILLERLPAIQKDYTEAIERLFVEAVHS
jgi:hypothetical protein